MTLELDTRYHERHKEKGSNQEKKPPMIESYSSIPPQGSSSKRAYRRKKKKGKNFEVSKDKPDAALLTKDNKFIGSEKEGGSEKAYVLIVVESTQLKNASRGLKIGKGHQDASLTSREKPELGS
ncbi:hypothetical protein O181_118701 [Austropuccinia psidii MF-1]|uniref:Uncharacterized protein n=1 Tax=Austropuccinia psidii MF-1 TaxID=1389203 RepID=A0A9Q3KEC6_9BASI|nr:hypothetical protein [Austropuccinia psidii MF-1]